MRELLHIDLRDARDGDEVFDAREGEGGLAALGIWASARMRVNVDGRESTADGMG